MKIYSLKLEYFTRTFKKNSYASWRDLAKTKLPEDDVKKQNTQHIIEVGRYAVKNNPTLNKKKKKIENITQRKVFARVFYFQHYYFKCNKI